MPLAGQINPKGNISLLVVEQDAPLRFVADGQLHDVNCREQVGTQMAVHSLRFGLQIKELAAL